ncbi:hypothetical protein [Bacillus oleivorans]|nr:hypothetical protein [Bacillus oleivorans]
MNEAFSRLEARFLERIKDASKEDLEKIEQAIEVLHSKLFY